MHIAVLCSGGWRKSDDGEKLGINIFYGYERLGGGEKRGGENDDVSPVKTAGRKLPDHGGVYFFSRLCHGSACLYFKGSRSGPRGNLSRACC